MLLISPADNVNKRIFDKTTEKWYCGMDGVSSHSCYSALFVYSCLVLVTSLLHYPDTIHLCAGDPNRVYCNSRAWHDKYCKEASSVRPQQLRQLRCSDLHCLGPCRCQLSLDGNQQWRLACKCLHCIVDDCFPFAAVHTLLILHSLLCLHVVALRVGWKKQSRPPNHFNV